MRPPQRGTDADLNFLDAIRLAACLPRCRGCSPVLTTRIQRARDVTNQRFRVETFTSREMGFLGYRRLRYR